MKVLICVDDSKATDIVLKESYSFLKYIPSVEIYIFSVIDVRTVTIDQGYTIQSYQIQEAEMDNLREKAISLWKGTPVIFDYMFGNPAEKIHEYATEINCDLLIIGTHGRTGIDHFLFGSVAEQVLKRTACKTLIIPVKYKL
jgi:Universal stress protein family